MKINGISVDLNLHFWIGLVIFTASAITSGTIHLTNAIPDAAIPYVVAWSSIVTVVGSGYLTVALGLHNADPQVRRDLVTAQPGTMVVTTDGSMTGLADKLATVSGVKNIISTPAVAAATASDKVVSSAAP